MSLARETVDARLAQLAASGDDPTAHAFRRD
jgi:hypothetical protein